MVPLGHGQAVLGGFVNGRRQKQIYSLTCSKRNCVVTTLVKELSVDRNWPVAIPIPDTLTGCIYDGNNNSNNMA